MSDVDPRSRIDRKSDKVVSKLFHAKKVKKRRKYKGKNPAGIPTGAQSVTRTYKNGKVTSTYKRKKRYGGKESQNTRVTDSFKGPIHLAPAHLRAKKLRNLKKT